MFAAFTHGYIKRSLCLTAVVLQLAGSQCMAQSGNVLDRLNRAEMSALGTTHKELPLPRRLSLLEEHIFGAQKTGGVASRIEGLEKVVGKNHSMMMPPVAPHLDMGEQPHAAPEIVKEQAGLFTSPYVTQQDGDTVLHANATTSSALSGASHVGAFANPLVQNNMNPLPANTNRGRMDAAAWAEATRASTTSAMAAQHANNSTYGATAERKHPARHPVMSGLARQAAVTGLGAALGRTGGGMLHCPICRLLR